MDETCQQTKRHLVEFLTYRLLQSSPSPSPETYREFRHFLLTHHRPQLLSVITYRQSYTLSTLHSPLSKSQTGTLPALSTFPSLSQLQIPSIPCRVVSLPSPTFEIMTAAHLALLLLLLFHLRPGPCLSRLSGLSDACSRAVRNIRAGYLRCGCVWCSTWRCDGFTKCVQPARL